jgi:hypothetical protein
MRHLKNALRRVDALYSKSYAESFLEGSNLLHNAPASTNRINHRRMLVAQYRFDTERQQAALMNSLFGSSDVLQRPIPKQGAN